MNNFHMKISRFTVYNFIGKGVFSIFGCCLSLSNIIYVTTAHDPDKIIIRFEILKGYKNIAKFVNSS